MVSRPSPLRSVTHGIIVLPSIRTTSKLFALNSQTKWKSDFVPLLKRWAGRVFNITQSRPQGPGYQTQNYDELLASHV